MRATLELVSLTTFTEVGNGYCEEEEGYEEGEQEEGRKEDLEEKGQEEVILLAARF